MPAHPWSGADRYISQLVTLDREALIERVGALPAKKLELVLLGIGIALGL